MEIDELENITELADLASFISEFLEDAVTTVRLDWFKTGTDEAITLAQFAAKFDLCDVAINEQGQEHALEFLFHPMHEVDEVPALTIPVDPDDVEVNILDRGLEIESLDFYMLISITSHSPIE